MNKFVYFLAVGLAFTVLQVATVSAADVSCAKLADGSLPPHCQKGNSEGGSGGNDGVALTIGDAKCTVANDMRDPRCPNYTAPGTTGSSPPGAASCMALADGSLPPHCN